MTEIGPMLGECTLTHSTVWVESDAVVSLQYTDDTLQCYFLYILIYKFVDTV